MPANCFSLVLIHSRLRFMFAKKEKSVQKFRWKKKKSLYTAIITNENHRIGWAKFYEHRIRTLKTLSWKYYAHVARCTPKYITPIIIRWVIESTYTKTYNKRQRDRQWEREMCCVWKAIDWFHSFISLINRALCRNKCNRILVHCRQWAM